MCQPQKWHGRYLLQDQKGGRGTHTNIHFNMDCTVQAMARKFFNILMKKILRIEEEKIDGLTHF